MKRRNSHRSREDKGFNSFHPGDIDRLRLFGGGLPVTCGVSHMYLYHFNFGWPLVDERTDNLWNGNWNSRGSELNNLTKAKYYKPYNTKEKRLAEPEIENYR